MAEATHVGHPWPPICGLSWGPVAPTPAEATCPTCRTREAHAIRRRVYLTMADSATQHAAFNTDVRAQSHAARVLRLFLTGFTA
ncbi:MAG: hypothetical protein OXG79_12610 [Chloroflexi bacterium]|nr:hypothetical protein [Chloroflexota bacterium]